MNETMDVTRFHKMRALAGYIAWLASGVPIFVLFLAREDRITSRAGGTLELVGCLIAYIAFIVCYALARHCGGGTGARRIFFGLLGIETVAALTVARLVPSGFAGVLMAVVVSQAASRLPLAWTIGGAAVLSTVF